MTSVVCHTTRVVKGTPMNLLTSSIINSSESILSHLSPVSDSDVIKSLGNIYDPDQLTGQFQLPNRSNIVVTISYNPNNVKKWTVYGGIVNIKCYKTFAGVRNLLQSVVK